MLPSLELLALPSSLPYRATTTTGPREQTPVKLMCVASLIMHSFLAAQERVDSNALEVISGDMVA